MNARSYRVNISLSPVDFPSIMGLGASTVIHRTEQPQFVNNKVFLTITKTYLLIDMDTNKQYEVLTAQSVYEIPSKEIKSREDVYEFYNDALLSLNEAYRYAQKKLPALPSKHFPNEPIEHYKGEIDRVFNLLISQN